MLNCRDILYNWTPTASSDLCRIFCAEHKISLLEKSDRIHQNTETPSSIKFCRHTHSNMIGTNKNKPYVLNRNCCSNWQSETPLYRSIHSHRICGLRHLAFYYSGPIQTELTQLLIMYCPLIHLKYKICFVKQFRLPHNRTHPWGVLFPSKWCFIQKPFTLHPFMKPSPLAHSCHWKNLSHTGEKP